MKCIFYELEGGEVSTIFVPTKLHEGHAGIIHGGLSAAVLDELMGRATVNTVNECEDKLPKHVTAEMTTKYLRPIPIGEKMFAYGRVDRTEGRRCYASSEIVNEDGELMATATGVYVKVNTIKGRTVGSEGDDKNVQPLTEKDPKVL